MMRLENIWFVAAFHSPPMHDPGPGEFKRPVHLEARPQERPVRHAFPLGVPARAILHVQLLALGGADERDLAARGQIVLRFHIPARRL